MLGYGYRNMRTIHKIHGFTLVELLITLVIVGILATTSYKAYGKFKVESTREEAKSALVSAHSYTERYLIESNTNDVSGMTLPTEISDTSNYSLSINSVEDSSHGAYYLSASVKSDSNQTNDSEECQSIILYQDGYRTNAPDGEENVCW